MEENFSMEWNMEWKILGMEWKRNERKLPVQSTLDLTDLDLTDFGFNGLRILPFRKHRLLYM